MKNNTKYMIDEVPHEGYVLKVTMNFKNIEPRGKAWAILSSDNKSMCSTIEAVEGYVARMATQYDDECTSWYMTMHHVKYPQPSINF